MQAKTVAAAQKPSATRNMVATAMLIALTAVMWFTPVGRIPLPVISVTIAHIPILIAVLTLGLGPGLAVALAFGAISLFNALVSPITLLDPFFVNPLVSILPRLMIPITTYVVSKGLSKPLGRFKAGNAIAAATAVAVGNLTNTFGVYGMLYLVYAKKILEETGTPAISLIVTSISTTTAIKCAVVVIVTVPIVMALRQALKNR